MKVEDLELETTVDPEALANLQDWIMSDDPNLEKLEQEAEKIVVQAFRMKDQS